MGLVLAISAVWGVSSKLLDFLSEVAGEGGPSAGGQREELSSGSLEGSLGWKGGPKAE